MPYRLVVTRPNGSQFQSTTEPLPSREAVGMSALRVLAKSGVAFGQAGLQLGRDIRDADLGENVIHAGSRFGFRTEEF